MNRLRYLLPLLIALICTGIYLYTAAPFMLFEDAPRLLAAITSLGIAKPAEPVYVFIAHWFIFLPFGSVVFRIQIFSAITAGVTLIMLYQLVTHILRESTILRQNKNQVSLEKSTTLQAGIFSMLVLGFSYQFWSQAQNVETFILTCFIELVVLNLLLKKVSKNKIFNVSTMLIGLGAIATGTDLPVIASVFPSMLLVLWTWKKYFKKKQFFILCLVGLIGIILAWSYLPFAASKNPLLKNVNGSTLEGIWDVATGGGSNAYDPTIGLINGLTWSPSVMTNSAWHYLVMLWTNFTPFLLPIIFLGAFYLWTTQRRIFYLLFLVISTNFTLSSLYFSGNQESWFLQSYVIFAIFAGIGYAWSIEILITRLPRGKFRIAQVGLFVISLLPLIVWWGSLNRNHWSLTQDYITNLYSPIQEPAILIVSGDLADSVSSYVYASTDYKHNTIPVMAGGFYIDWLRNNYESAGMNMPDPSILTKQGSVVYSKYMNELFAKNIGKYHIYLTLPAFEDKTITGDHHSIMIDTNRFNLVPVGMLQEVIPKNAKPDFNLDSFFYRFTNGFPQTKPHLLEQSYNTELNGIIREIARSYGNAANYLLYQEQLDEADSLYEKGYALNPSDSQILGGLGEYYIARKQPQKALTYFSKAQKSQPDNLTWLLNMAQTEVQLGMIDEARKHFNQIINNPTVDSEYKQTLKELMNQLNENKSSDEAGLKTEAPILYKFNHFTDKTMNIQFNYPKTITLTQINPQLVSLSNPELPDDDRESKFYIYSADITNKDPIPFPIPGKLKQSNATKLRGFQATINIYTDGSEERKIILMRQGNQLFALRFPKQKAFTSLTIDKIVDSINTLY